MRALYYLVALLAPVVDLKWFEEGLWYVDFTVNLAVGKNRKFTMEVRPFLPSLVVCCAGRCDTSPSGTFVSESSSSS